MKTPVCLLCILLLVPLAPLGADDPPQNPWTLDLSVGVLGFAPGPLPVVELGWFHRALALDDPDFFDLGLRVARRGDAWRLGFGARHHLYFSPWRVFDQEVLLGILAPDLTPTLYGRFGLALPLGQGPTAYPAYALEIHALWVAEGIPFVRPVESAWGLSLGLGGNGVGP